MKRRLMILFMILTLLCALFIFSNSIVTGARMTTRESGVLKAVQSIVNRLSNHPVDLDNKNAHHILSKLAHLGEFTLFSGLFTTAVYLFHQKTRPYFFQILSIGMFIAVTDEHLQLVTNGRSSRVSDVMIDTCGILIGFAIVDQITRRIRRKKGKKE